jgi:hypothetical protein
MLLLSASDRGGAKPNTRLINWRADITRLIWKKHSPFNQTDYLAGALFHGSLVGSGSQV